MNREKYLKISETFDYWELRYIELALEAFRPDYAINEAKAQELKENITAARGWVHHLGKTDRTER